MTGGNEDTRFVQVAGAGKIQKDAVKIALRLGNRRGQYFLLLVFADGTAMSFTDDPEIMKQFQRNFSFKDCTKRESALPELANVTDGPNRTRFTMDVAHIPGGHYTLAIQENHGHDMVPMRLTTLSPKVEREQLIPRYKVKVTESTEMIDVNEVVDMNEPNKFVFPSP